MQTQSPDIKRKLALFYFLLQSKYLVPAITIDAIAFHVADLLFHHASQLHQCMIDTLKACEVNVAIMQHLTSKCKINDDLKRLHVDGDLRSNYSHNIYFKNNFMFVFPVSMQLSSIHDATETATYQYVPILDSLKAILKDASVRKQFLNPTDVSQCIQRF